MDQLENYINTNRSAFDRALPNHDLWPKIDAELEKDQLESYIRQNRASFDQAEPKPDLWSQIKEELEKDQLETYIETNKSSFDQALPNHDLWSKIEQELEDKTEKTKGRIVRMNVVRYAAAAIVLIAISVFGTYQFMKPTQMVASAEVLQELEEIQTFYDFEVNRKLQKLATFNTDENILDNLEEIDSVIEELKIELSNVPEGSEDRVIKAMIDNYKLKVYILESVLEGQEQYFIEKKASSNEVSI